MDQQNGQSRHSVHLAVAEVNGRPRTGSGKSGGFGFVQPLNESKPVSLPDDNNMNDFIGRMASTVVFCIESLGFALWADFFLAMTQAFLVNYLVFLCAYRRDQRCIAFYAKGLEAD